MADQKEANEITNPEGNAYFRKVGAMAHTNQLHMRPGCVVGSRLASLELSNAGSRRAEGLGIPKQVPSIPPAPEVARL